MSTVHILKWPLLQARRHIIYVPKIMSSSLQDVLGEHSTAKYFIEYDGFLSNHLSHGVIALDRLGCNDDRINKFIQWYIPKLEKPREESDKDCEDIDQLKGKRVCYYAILEHFEKLYREKYKENLDELIANELPRLSEGLAGSAVHGFIHTGYGFAARNERVVLEGLAYLHHSSLPIVSTVDEQLGKGTTEIIDILSAIAKDDSLQDAVLAGKDKPEYTARKLGGFQRKVSYLLTEHGDMLVSSVLSIKLPVEVFNEENTIDVLRLAKTVVKWAIVVYTIAERKNDFFLVHGVTSAWALLQMVPVLKEHDALVAIRHYLTVLVAVFIAEGAPALTIPMATDREVTEEDWAKLVERTLAVDRDEHCYKLVQVCHEMRKDDPGASALYMQAAESTLENEFLF